MAEASSGLCQALAPPSPEAGDITSHWASPGCQRRSLFWCLRRKKPSHGLLEIGPGHELHPLASMMQAGLWAATQVSLKQPPAGPPTEKDFSEVLTQAHKGFELDTLAGPAFAWLRHSLGLAEEDYQDALGPGGPYLQFFSPSKSKSIFFLSHDRRFFLKTQQRREVQVLLAHLPRYVQHLQRHPYTLLTRLLGVHTLRMAQGKKEYFIVMLSVFYPASGRLLELYDIKGCEVDRWVEPVSDDCSIMVLKDLNFQGKTIHLGPQRTWLLYQMELDTAFLRDLNVMDYSLILAFHQHQDGERTEASSLPQASSARFVEGIQNLEEVELPQNYRLLSGGPHAPNILDGPEQRYFLGLVDLATVYGLRRRLEYLWKMLWYSGRNFSTVNPTRYARRLCQWVEAHSD